jgi:photosynthetic reaction center cytochrome c subunit
MNFWINMGAAAAVVGAIGIAFTFEMPPVKTQQLGYRGLGMEQVDTVKNLAAKRAANQSPEVPERIPPGGGPASAEYQNVQVLKDVSVDEFGRLMAAITEWVSPEQGCAYCHAEGEELSSDKLYTKVVARRMLEMTQHINAEWQKHVGQTGVTCYTCHRGQPVPANIWFKDPGPPQAMGMAASRQGQNLGAKSVGLTSLPADVFESFLKVEPSPIRVASTTALPTTNRTTIQQTEWSYGLMMHLSDALGVNCTFCHNSRSFAPWDQSSPARVTAWHGIQMVRDLNVAYLDPLKPAYPPERLGVLGDAPKANCATCHAGVSKPLYGVSMIKDFPELATKPK